MGTSAYKTVICDMGVVRVFSTPASRNSLAITLSAGSPSSKTAPKRFTASRIRAGYHGVTIMSFTGHEDMKTVLKYAVAAEAKDTQERFNSIVWTAAA
jgi:hypothetical protein